MIIELNTCKSISTVFRFMTEHGMIFGEDFWVSINPGTQYYKMELISEKALEYSNYITIKFG